MDSVADDAVLGITMVVCADSVLELELLDCGL